MKKKIIMGVIALVLIAAIVFGVIFAVKCYKRNAMHKFALVVSDYFEATKIGNNELMSVAGVYEGYADWGSFEDASKEVEDNLGRYKGLRFEVDKAYEAVKKYEIKYDEAAEIKAIVEPHYEQYIKFEDNILNHSEENYGAGYGRIYKDWQIPFADEHHKLRNILAKYR